MKALILIFILLSLNFYPTNIAIASEPQFARITNNNIYFYSAPADDSKLFTLPNTYFVELLEKAGSAYYKARYIDLYGYVKVDDVTPVVGVPSNPFAEKQSLRVIAPSYLEMRSGPKSTSPFEIVDTVPYLTVDIIYYGSISGEPMVPDSTNIWHYCKYVKQNTSSTGYLYSLFCDKLQTAPPNTEILDIKTTPVFPDPLPEKNTVSNLNFSSPAQIAIVVAVSLPCLLIVYLIFKPTKIVNEQTKKKKRKIHRLKHSDYYELED